MAEILHFEILRKHGQTNKQTNTHTHTTNKHTNEQTNRHGHYVAGAKRSSMRQHRSS